MNEEHSQDTPATITKTKVGRRGLLGILGAVGAGFAAKKLAEPERAGAADPNDIVKNNVNEVGTRTALQSAAGSFGNLVAFEVDMTPATSQVTALSGIGAGAGYGVKGVGGGGGGSGGTFTGGSSGGGGLDAHGVGSGRGVSGQGGLNGGTGGHFEGGGGDAWGVVGVGRGVSEGVRGRGGDSSGDGVSGTGGTTNGRGVVGTGAGNGAGVFGTGGTNSGRGGIFVGGGSDGEGLLAQATGNAAGVDGVGGQFDGAGGIFTGGGNNGVGVIGQGGFTNGAGVQGSGYGVGSGGRFFGGASSGTGLTADGGAPNGNGVVARSQGSGAAVSADALGFGTGTGSGVDAVARATHASGGAAVKGWNSEDGPGVLGISNNGIGVFGYNTGSGDGDPAACGGFFTTAANNTNAMVAQVFGNVTNAAAFLGVAQGAGNIAGYFVGQTQFQGPMLHTGNVNITGDLTVTGAKNAVVPMADGKLHRVYSMESPEAWFEDFGRGTLQRGSARVGLPADFAQVVKADDYLVFLTENGPNQQLYVGSQDSSGFTVQSNSGAAGAFNYRIVAKRKDIAAPRLEAFVPPPVRTVRLNTIPPTGPVGEGPPAGPAPAPAPRGR